MAGRRVDDVADNVFRASGRINSTWGGGLVDMVRSRRILEIIEADGLFDHAAKLGDVFLRGLHEVADAHPSLVSNVRGRGLMCAFDLPDTAARDNVLTELRNERVVVLDCGNNTLRFRPPLSVTEAELKIGLAALDRVLGALTPDDRGKE
jgi:L-lysine 6-transaminase